MLKATVYIADDPLWRAFRKACIDHKTSASKAIEQLMREQLARWAEANGDRQAAAELYARIIDSANTQALLVHKKETPHA
jgi:hypothetical protein